MDLKITARLDENGNLEFTTIGRWVSLNFIMTTANWSSDGHITDIIKRKVQDAIRGIDLWYDTGYRIVLRYNSRMDDHNTVMMPKFFTDCIQTAYEKNNRQQYIMDPVTGGKILKFKGFIPNDDKRYSGGTNLIPDNTLKHNTYIMTYERIVLNWKPVKNAKRVSLEKKGDELGGAEGGGVAPKRVKVLRKSRV